MKNETQEVMEFIQNPKFNNIITIQQQAVQIKEYLGQRVVTFSDIDKVHNRTNGTAGRNFRANRKYFIKDTDYFEITPDEFRRTIGTMDIRQMNKVYVFTLSGYLMLAKSFTDDLSWQVQRELVNSYFKVKQSGLIKQNDDYKTRNLAVKEMNARSRQAQTLVRLAQLTQNSICREAMIAQAANTASGRELLPLPNLPAKTYKAEEIGAMLGVSRQKIGRLANLHNLNTDEYGGWFADFVPVKGEVQTFRYYETVLPVLKSLIETEVAV